MSVAQNNAVRTLGQIRAQKAWDTVEKATRLGDNDKEDFGREAKKLPTRIITAGLGHALAFVKAKGKTGPGKALLYRSVSEMIAERIPPRSEGGKKKEPSDLLERIVRGDAVFLRRATAETLEYLQWVARFAEARGLTGSEDSSGV